MRWSMRRPAAIPGTALLLLSVALFVTATGCAGVQGLTVKVNNGDTKDKVVELMGVPEDRQLKGEQEAWQYSSVVAMGICEYAVVWFDFGHVTGINTYRNASIMGCRSGMRTVNWQEAPDRVIEYRRR